MPEGDVLNSHPVEKIEQEMLVANDVLTNPKPAQAQEVQYKMLPVEFELPVNIPTFFGMNNLKKKVLLVTFKLVEDYIKMVEGQRQVWAKRLQDADLPESTPVQMPDLLHFLILEEFFGMKFPEAVKYFEGYLTTGLMAFPKQIISESKA